MSRKLAAVIGMLLTGFLLCGFAGPAAPFAPLRWLAQEAEEPVGTPWWVWLLIIVVLLFAAFLWWLWWSRRGEEKPLPDVERKPVSPVHAAEAQAPEIPVRAAEAVVVQPDDLEIIEGIGPKIAGLLKAAGITTFAQLADADLVRIQDILHSAKLRLADPTTWGDQARLAAAGDWDALETLQGKLKAGRRA